MWSILCEHLNGLTRRQWVKTPSLEMSNCSLVVVARGRKGLGIALILRGSLYVVLIFSVFLGCHHPRGLSSAGVFFLLRHFLLSQHSVWSPL